MSTRHARSGDVRIAYEVAGSGRPLVLVHGLGYARWGWGPVPELLAERRTVVTIDNRGIGASDVPPGPYTAAGMAGDVLAVMDDAGIDRADVVGTSLGGMVAQELAIEHPQRVGRLVLVCTTPGGERAFPMPEGTRRLIAGVAGLEPAVALRRFVANALSPDADPMLVEQITALREADPPDPAGWAAQAAAGTGYDGAGRHRRISAPTLVVHGTGDAVVDVRNARLLADEIPGAALHLVERAGHLLFWEHPQSFTAAVLDWIEGAP